MFLYLLQEPRQKRGLHINTHGVPVTENLLRLHCENHTVQRVHVRPEWGSVLNQDDAHRLLQRLRPPDDLQLLDQQEQKLLVSQKPVGYVSLSKSMWCKPFKNSTQCLQGLFSTHWVPSSPTTASTSMLPSNQRKVNKISNICWFSKKVFYSGSKRSVGHEPTFIKQSLYFLMFVVLNLG